MSLPELIEIKPLAKPVKAEITVPGSKSITNRALILAALANGTTTLRGALWSEDTQAMADCLQKLGFALTVAPDEKEFCNRTITVQGLGGKIPNGGTPQKPLELFVGNAGTAARFLAAFVCLGTGVYRLSGVPRMHERPQGALFKALRELGYEVESEKRNDKLPVTIFGSEPLAKRETAPYFPKYQDSLTLPIANKPARTCSVSIEESSQFASALFLCAKHGDWEIKVVGENAEESPYVAMTTKLVEVFPKSGGSFQIEPDASGGAYILMASKIIGHAKYMEYSATFGIDVETSYFNPFTVNSWPTSGWQIDAEFPRIMERLKEQQAYLSLASRIHDKEGRIPAGIQDELEKLFRGTITTPVECIISRKNDLGDSIMAAIVLAPLEEFYVKFTDLGRLRVQECERVFALRTELTKCGAKVEETGDTLTVHPSKLHGAEIETYNDHRMAMCFAVLGLKVPGIKIRNPACVKKTFPNFFQKLAAAPPHGLGAVIVDADTQKPLEGDELFAD